MNSNCFHFTSDWFSSKTKCWDDIKKLKGWDTNSRLEVVEIGSYEGRSSCWILENLFFNSESKLYSIDTFLGGMEHSSDQTKNLFDKFVNNIKCTGKDHQVEILQGSSDDQLIKLIIKGVEADLIYIDGSHVAKDVLTDAVLSWKLLKRGGILIFDDYLWRAYDDLSLLPKFAIDSFVNIFFKELALLRSTDNFQQYILKK